MSTKDSEHVHKTYAIAISPPTSPNTDVEKKSNQVIVTDESVRDIPTKYVEGIKLVLVAIALVLAIFLVSLDMTIVATAIPKITDEFHGLDLVSWYGAAFFMCTAAFQSTWGKAYKYFPIKTTFLVAIFVFELGSLVCALAPNAVALIAGRAIAGIGGAGLASGAYTIIAFAASPRKRPLFTALIGASYGIATVVGPLLGGVFTNKASWRWCFYINLPIGFISACIILLFFNISASASAKISLVEKILQMDPLGTLIVLGAVSCYILALQWGGQTKPWDSSPVIGLFIGFGLLSIAFGFLEYFQGERAMITPRLFRDRVVYISSLYAFFFVGSYLVILFVLPIYFQSVDGVSPIASGVRNLPIIIAVTIAMIVSGGIISMNGHYVPYLIVGGAVATIAAGLLYTLDVGSSSGRWIGFQALAGLGWGLSFQVPIIAAQGSVVPDDIATVTSVVLFFQTVGSAFFVSAGQSALVSTIIRTLPVTAPGVDPWLVIKTGATQIRAVFPAAQVAGIIEAYMAGVKVAFAIAIAGAGCAFVLSIGSKYTKLGKDENVPVMDETVPAVEGTIG